MTVVKSDIPRLLQAGLQTLFQTTFGQTPAHWPQVATVVPSNKDTEQYAWLGALPGLREFVDERQVADFPHEYEYAIKNKTWESTLAVDRDALEDDQYGQIALRVRQMAQVAKTHMDEIVFGLLADGFARPCYDGRPFFGDHTQGGITQTNKGTDPLSADSLRAAITALSKLKDDQGRPAVVTPDLLVCAPDLRWTAEELLHSVYTPGPITAASQDLSANPLKDAVRLLATPWLDGASWYLLDTTRVVRAIVLQMRTPFAWEALEDQSESGFLRGQYLYGVRARYNVGFGDWRAAFGAEV